MNILWWLLTIWLGCGFLTAVSCIVIDMVRRIEFRDHNWGLIGEQILKGPISLFYLILVLWMLISIRDYDKDNNNN